MLAIDSLSKTWPGGRGQRPVTALSDVNLTVESGEFVSIIGPSGCGKTTLMEVVAGLVQPTGGQVRLDGQPLDRPHQDVGVVFQEDSSLPWLTAQKNVEFGLEFRGVTRKERPQLALDALGLVGLGGFESHFPGQLSGGMRQRVNMARVLAAFPRLVLMDEPFGALDEQTRLVLGDELVHIREQTGSTILFITHSLNEAAMLSDRVVVMSSNPGAIKAVVDNAPSEERGGRAMGSEAFSRMTARLWDLLRDDARAVAEKL